MLNRRNLLVTSAAAAGLAACASTPPGATSAEAGAPTAAAGGARTGEAARFHAMMDEWMQRNLRRSPELVTSLGLDKGEWAASKGQLGDVSLAQVERDEAETLRRLSEIRAIDRDALNGLDRVHYDTLRYGQEQSAQAVQRFDLKAGGLVSPYGLSQLTGAYQSIPDFLDTAHTIETAADAEAYLSRLDAFARVLDQEIETNRHDVGMGVIAPDFAIDKALGQMRALRNNAAAASPLVQSVVRRTREKKIAGDWEARASAIYTGRIQPAFDRQLALLTQMRTRATHDAGVWKIRDGEAFYAMSVRQATTTDMTPDQIHQTGLELVASLTAKTDTLMRAQGLTQGTVGERFKAMYADPQFRYPNTDEAKQKLLTDLNAQVEAIRGKLPRYFGQLPKTPLEIRRVPPFIEAGAPGGYYNTGSLDGTRPGVYWINLRDTAETPDLDPADAHLPRGSSGPSPAAHPAAGVRGADADEGGGLQRLRRRLGALLRRARRRDGHVRERPLGRDRHAARRPVPGCAPGGGQRHARQALEPRAGGEILRRRHRRPGSLGHHRDRALRRLAGPGDQLHGGQDQDHGAARPGAPGAGFAVRHPQVPRHRASERLHAARRAGAGSERLGHDAEGLSAAMRRES
jgi:uncharacterized protein (DUF885 family)